MAEETFSEPGNFKELVPEKRYYADSDDAVLDTMLEVTAEKAELAGNEHLASVLWYELGSHHQENGVDLDHENSRATPSLSSIAQRL